MNNEQKAKDYITEALLQLMEKNDYQDISITDITKKAGVNRVTFYRNFNNKDEVISKCLKLKIENFKNNNKETKNGLYEVLKYIEMCKDILKPIYNSHAEHLFLKHILDIWNNTKEEQNIWAYTKSAWAYFMFGWANEWYLRGMKETPEELLKIIETMQNKG